MWDWLSNFGNFFNQISPALNFGYNLYNQIGNQGGGGGGYQGQPQGFDPSEWMKNMMAAYQPPDFSEMFAGLAEMQAGQQKMLEEQQMKGMARQAVSARRGMQAQGVYDGGAVTEDALANLLGVDDPDMFRRALAQYGKEYGWT